MNFKKSFSKAKMAISDKSPEILLGCAIISFGATVFFACKGTTKIEAIKKEHEDRIMDVDREMAKKASDDPEYRDDDYTEADAKRDKFIISTQTAGKFVKAYAPAFICGAVSITCMLASYNILHKRYVAASTLAASLYSSFKKYRDMVVAEYGEEVDNHFYLGTKYDEIVEKKENGKEAKKKVECFNDANGIPIYAKFFDESCPAWSKDPSINLTYLRCTQSRANDYFHEHGVLLLNQVYSMLGIPVTDIGNEVGWFESHGDSFVDFGVYGADSGTTERIRAFVNGYEPSILLNFNCVPKMPGDLPKY